MNAVATDSPWARPPFWRTEHSLDEKRHKAFRRLYLLRRKLWRTPSETTLWFRILREINKSEKQLGLQLTTIQSTIGRSR